MEIEAKFRVPDADCLRRLGDAASLGGFLVAEGRSKDLSDVYLDTREWSLLHAGYSCRRRTGDDGVLITVKQLSAGDDAVHRREEFEVLLPVDAPPGDWPESPARDLVLGFADDAPLGEMLSLSQRRTVRMVGPADSPVAELSLDEVSLTGGDAPYFEVEAELKEGGTERDLEVLAAVLRDAWSLEPEPRSKFQRAVAALGLREGDSGEEPPVPESAAVISGKGKSKGHKGREEPPSMLATEPAAPSVAGEAPTRPGIEAGDTMGEAARKTLLFHLLRMVQCEPGTRAGEDAEDLHDMRVATRRMRAAMRVFRDYLDPKAFRPFLKAMRETGQTLGTVRDLDVFRIKMDAYVDTLPEGSRSGLNGLLAAWEEERESAREKMLCFLDSGRYVRFRDGFEEFLRTPGAGEMPRIAADGEPLPSRVRDVLPAVLYERFATVRAFDEWISGSDVPLIRFHQLRISSKGLRYTLEFFQEVLGADAKVVIDKTKLLQDHLGDMQDAIVACDVLLGFLTTGTWGPPKTARFVPRGMAAGSPGVAVYLAEKEMEIDALRGSFPPVWEQIRGPEFSRPLAALVADL